MSFPLNEYKILRIIKRYFDALKASDVSLEQTFKYLFDSLDISEVDRIAFRDIIVNNKIQYQTSYSNLSTVMPNIVVIMDQEVNVESYNSIGYKLDHDTITEQTPNGPVNKESDAFGAVMTGVYSINIICKQILLARLLAIFIRFILMNYNSVTDDWASMDLNTDRFSPDADYFPTDSFHIHIIARFEYIESWNEIYDVIHGIFLQSCGNDYAQYLTIPLDSEVGLGAKGTISGSQE